MPLVALMAAGLVGSMWFVGVASNGAREKTQAQTAADAAALAAVSDGSTGAETAAKANGAELIDLSTGPGRATAKVKIGSHSATAQAQTD